MRKSDLKLGWCSHAAAKYACVNWHYTGTIPISKGQYIGVWEFGKFIGAAIFTCGTGAACNGSRYGLSRNFEMAELQRVALNRHKTTVTRILSIAIRMIKASSPKLRLLVSFADPMEGHSGGIYKGGNWIFTGISPITTEFLLSDGRWIHRRTIGNQWGKLAKANRLKVLKTRRRDGKLRYLYPLDPEMRSIIERLRKPFPSASEA